eukprot:12405419-Karenia_brevis.AAC.1
MRILPGFLYLRLDLCRNELRTIIPAIEFFQAAFDIFNTVMLIARETPCNELFKKTSHDANTNVHVFQMLGYI